MKIDPARQIDDATQENGANSHELLAYKHGQNYSRQPLSGNAGITGGYICDKKPQDFDNQSLVRTAERPIAKEVIKCSVQSSFIDSSVFTDTNILLEILQNAEPKDSKGTWFGLEFFADGEWRPVIGEIDKFKDQEVQAVRISDNGKGYMPKDMTTLGGAKRKDRESAGRFGSGMKISDRSALGKGIQVQRCSRNWRAKPYLEPVLTSAGWDQTVSYNVEYLEKIHQGSVVEYRNLTPEILVALRKIEEIYLPLDRTFEERLLAETNVGLLLKPRKDKGEVMVNGRKYTLTVDPPNPMLFSYDLQNVSIDDQNRHYVDAAKAETNIVQIWSELTNPTFFEKLIEAARNNHEVYELSMPGMTIIPNCFQKVLKKLLKIENFDLLYLKDTELEKDDEKSLKRKGYKCIDNKLAKHRFFAETLKNMGILPGKKLIDEVTVSFWGEEVGNLKGETFISSICKGIVSLRNLRQFDDSQKEIVIRFKNTQTEEEQEIDLREFLKNKTVPTNSKPLELICRIKNDYIRQDEKNYEEENQQLGYKKLLEYFAQFLGACSVAGTSASITNGNLELEPVRTTTYSHSTINKVRSWKNSPLENLEIHIYLENASQINEMGEIGKYSLDMNPNYQPIAKTRFGDVVSVSEGMVYDQGIHDKNAALRNILSYNFTVRRIPGKEWRDIRNILGEANDIRIAKAVLEKAEETGNEITYPEYGFRPIGDGVAQVWKQAFEEIFGAETAIDDIRETGTEYRELMTDAKEKSGIKTVSLHGDLKSTLISCGARTLSSAVRAKQIKEYSPNPIQEALLTVNKIADKAIGESLPPGVRMVRPGIKTVKEIENEYGQTLTSGNGYGYLDPTLDDKTIYVFDNAIQQNKIGSLLTFILQKRIEAHRNQMNQDEYTEFKATVMAIAERSLTSLEFIREIRRILFKKGQKVVELVDKVVQDIPREEENENSNVFRIREKRKEPRSTQGLTATLKKLGKPIGIISATVACAALVLIGGNFATKKLKEVGWFKQIKAHSTDPSYSSAWQDSDSNVSVSIGRTGASTETQRLTTAQMGKLRSSFVSVPELAWGYFLNDAPLNQYNGKGWSTDLKAPDFENPKFPEVLRIAHMQRIGEGQKTVFLKPLSGGYIDPASIVLHRENGQETKEVLFTPGIYGAYEISLANEDDIVAVSYHNLMPMNWKKEAEKLTDKDFEELSEEAYGYHTQTPNLDLSKIRFSSEVFPQAKNLEEFINYLKTRTPFQRISLIHAVVSKMRYTRTERTESAFKKFHEGELPEKDLLEFVLNSDELENPGDGDCDVQNSIFTLLARYAGIPAKMDFVHTRKGIGHGPATVFFPKIGWVITDSMGERSLVEGVEEDAGITDSSSEIQVDEHKAQQELLRILENRKKYEELGCSNLL